ncbi:hypothetical protein CK203_024020 [Vitis vinifera]|uniref:Uncharacterized protein n=1 Tax=Vitis vinifera TaxID=29760 RepID=A0A438IQ54_VITVI|nr:hypothetical protein CK203_024020 [Vitis vinifera]
MAMKAFSSILKTTMKGGFIQGFLASGRGVGMVIVRKYKEEGGWCSRAWKKGRPNVAASRRNGSLDSSVHETNWKSKRMKELLRRLHVIRKGTKDVMTWQLSKGDTFIVKSFYSSLAGCLCMEEKEEGMESSFFVLILDLMEEEKPTSL